MNKCSCCDHSSSSGGKTVVYKKNADLLDEVTGCQYANQYLEQDFPSVKPSGYCPHPNCAESFVRSFDGENFKLPPRHAGLDEDGYHITDKFAHSGFSIEGQGVVDAIKIIFYHICAFFGNLLRCFGWGFVSVIEAVPPEIDVAPSQANPSARLCQKNFTFLGHNLRVIESVAMPFFCTIDTGDIYHGAYQTCQESMDASEEEIEV